MYFKYGGYLHPKNEVVLAGFLVHPVYSDRGRRTSMMYEMHLKGEICINDPSITTPAQMQAAIKVRINEIIDAYRLNYQDAMFLHDDGVTPTPHCLLNSNSLSGVQLITRSWPKGDQAEYATSRTFHLAFRSEQLDPESELVYYHETLRFIGTGGPRYVVTDTATGPPRYDLVNLRTHQTITQVGTAVGLEGYPLVDIYPLYPQWEHLERREYILGTPRSRRNGWTHYPIQWAYHFSLPTGTNGAPIPR